MSLSREFNIVNNGPGQIRLDGVSLESTSSGFSLSLPPTPVLPVLLNVSDQYDFNIIASRGTVGEVSTNAVASIFGRSPITKALTANFVAPVIEPDQVSGLQCWWDASQMVGFSNGDRVGNWTDLARGIAMTNPIASRYPTYLTNIQNGLPAVRFDRSTFQFLYSPLQWAVTQQYVFLIGKMNTSTFINAAGGNGRMFTTSQTGTQSFEGIAGTTNFDPSQYGASTTYEYLLDGVVTPSGAAGNLSPHIYEMGRGVPKVDAGSIRFYMGVINEANVASAISMDIFEGFMYDHKPAADELTGLRSYGSDKWGIALGP